MHCEHDDGKLIPREHRRPSAATRHISSHISHHLSKRLSKRATLGHTNGGTPFGTKHYLVRNTQHLTRKAVNYGPRFDLSVRYISSSDRSSDRLAG